MRRFIAAGVPSARPSRECCFGVEALDGAESRDDRDVRVGRATISGTRTP